MTVIVIIMIKQKYRIKISLYFINVLNQTYIKSQ